MTQRLPAIAAALWWGSLTTLFVVVPLLFAHLPSPALAGNTAAKLFSAQTWMSIGCALLLLATSHASDDGRPSRAREALFFVLLGLLLALLAEYAVAPRILTRVDLRLWHSIGSAMYLLQWACAATVLWRLLGEPTPASAPRSSVPDE